MKINFINLQAQYQKYKNEIDEQIKEVLDSSVYIGGKVGELEENLAKFSGAKHAIACSSGTDALLLAFMALDIKRRGHHDAFYLYRDGRDDSVYGRKARVCRYRREDV